MAYPVGRCLILAETEVTQSDVIKALSQEVLAQLAAAGAVSVPRKRRMRMDWERILALEYVDTFYREKPHWMREGIGPIPPGEEGKYYTKTRRWADAIVRDDDALIIIEAKMEAEPSVIGQILNYGRLLPQTPMFRKYTDLPIKLRVVTASTKDDVKEMVEHAGIEFVEFKPSNFDKWYAIKKLGKSYDEVMGTA